MRNLSKFVFIVFSLFLATFGYLFYKVNYVSATLEPPEGKVEDPEPKPEFRYPCSSPGLDPEFHSLRPYQAAPCGGATLAKFCSNELIFIEEFDLARKGCTPKRITDDWTCYPNAHVGEHDLYIELSGSELPILGNTEQVTNSFGGTEEYDDATKVNEYASWYLSGVNGRAEYGEPTNDQVVNFSGPLNKLYPQMLQEAERINTIDKASSEMFFLDETGTGEDGKTNEALSEYENHDQIVVCADEKIFGLFGNVIAKPCPDGKSYHLSEWLGDLSLANTATNTLTNFINSLPQTITGVVGYVSNEIIGDVWTKRFPPLPWNDGTGKPFESDILYKKAYNEWLGKQCGILPVFGLVCVDIPGVASNEWSDLYHYIPLSSTADKKGSNYIKGDGPSYDAGGGTVIENAMHKSFSGAPLYFAHTQETKELSQLLNNTFTPMDTCVSDCMALDGNTLKQCRLDCDKEKESASKSWPKDVEKIKQELGEDCSLANVRVNQGDNLFAGNKVGSPKEMWVKGVQYDIKEVVCHEVYERYRCEDKETGALTWCIDQSFNCPAYIKISIKTGTKNPNVNEIFTQTVAGEASTFRKIFPKIGEGTPVECIADIPTSTDVYYDPTLSDYPVTDTGAQGDNTFKVNPKPDDTSNDVPQLTFPHVGSVYEYFLNGIQTALRPKGYGEPIANGNCKSNIACGELPELPKASGSCNLGSVSSRVGDIPQNLKDIVSAAAETYKVPPNLIIGVLFGEGVFNIDYGSSSYKNYDWTEENVKDWASCTPLPNCSGPSSSIVSFVSDSLWSKTAEKIKDDLNKLDPNKTEPDPCNLIDSIYAIAWNLHDSADGGMDFQCFGKDLKASIPTSCDWDDNQLISAIKIFENGYEKGCFTKQNSCATGGGYAALCDGGGDTCETITNRYSSQPSHMGCVFDVAKGN